MQGYLSGEEAALEMGTPLPPLLLLPVDLLGLVDDYLTFPCVTKERGPPTIPVQNKFRPPSPPSGLQTLLASAQPLHTICPLLFAWMINVFSIGSQQSPTHTDSVAFISKVNWQWPCGLRMAHGMHEIFGELRGELLWARRVDDGLCEKFSST